MKKQNRKDRPSLESSLKSVETENWLDRVFYRRLGFFFAKMFSRTSVTPNEITIASFFVGIAGAFCFLYEGWLMALYGVVLLVLANIMDCVDGQLARLTGIKSKVGRILDGFAGDLWFATLYIVIIFRSIVHYDLPIWFAIFPVLSGLSHSKQASITDYYKTFHLMLINKKKGAEFDNHANLEAQYQALSFKKEPVYTVLMFFYRKYTVGQEKVTPHLQVFLNYTRKHHNDIIPENIGLEFRKRSLELMPLFDMMTFNGRTPLLFVTMLLGFPYYLIYLFYEIVVLNIVRIVAIRRHERLSHDMLNLMQN